MNDDEQIEAEAIIRKIFRLSDEMPDAELHARWLRTLRLDVLRERLHTIEFQAGQKGYDKNYERKAA